LSIITCKISDQALNVHDSTGGTMSEPGQTQGGRGRPFTKGNGGRKPGAKNRTTQVAAALLAGEEQELVRKAVEVAKAGDVTMLKFWSNSAA
jgi:hypothetical protein